MSTRLLTRKQNGVWQDIAYTLTCVQSEAPVKTEIESNAGLKPYTEVETLKEDEAVAIVYTRAHMFPQVPA